MHLGSTEADREPLIQHPLVLDVAGAHAVMTA